MENSFVVSSAASFLQQGSLFSSYFIPLKHTCSQHCIRVTSVHGGKVILWHNHLICLCRSSNWGVEKLRNRFKRTRCVRSCVLWLLTLTFLTIHTKTTYTQYRFVFLLNLVSLCQCVLTGCQCTSLNKLQNSMRLLSLFSVSFP